MTGRSYKPPGNGPDALGGAFLGPVPRWMTPSIGILYAPLARLSLDGMTTSLGVAGAPSRLLVRLRLDDRALVQAAGQRAGCLGRGFPWTRSSVDDPLHRHTVLSAGAPVIGWHDYLAWRICARRQDCLSGVVVGSSRLTPGGLLGSHILGGASLGPVPLMTIPRLRLLFALVVRSASDGMTTSLGAFARAVRTACRASSAVPAACRQAACSRATSWAGLSLDPFLGGQLLLDLRHPVAY